MSREEGTFILKDPDSVEPYGFDWTDYLAELGASITIQSSTWAVTGPATNRLTLTDDSIVTGSKKTQVRLNGGVSGKTYVVTNSIVTSNGVDKDDRSFQVLVGQK